MISELENVSYELDPLRIKCSLPLVYVMMYSSPTDWFRIAIHFSIVRKTQATLQAAKAALLRDSQSWANHSPWIICALIFFIFMSRMPQRRLVSATYLLTKITLWNFLHGLLLHAWCSLLCLVVAGKQNLWHRLFWLSDQQQSCFLYNALFFPLVALCFIWYTLIKNLARLAKYEIKKQIKNQPEKHTPKHCFLQLRKLRVQRS